MEAKQTHTLVIGASIAGLAVAASLQRRNLEYTIIEKQAQVVAPWRNHYDRLHLHTSKRFSHLPFRKFGREIPRYPSKQQVLDYIDSYRQAFHIQPVFNCIATSVRKDGSSWITETTNGLIKSTNLVMCTGAYGKPKPIRFDGMESFPGPILHSREYKTGAQFKGQNVLVVGFGNSACEIAMDLLEQGATSSMAVRSAVNVIPRDILGVPILELSILMRPLPPRIGDILSEPLIRMMIGDLTKVGLRKLPYGPLEQIVRDGSVPLLDIGTIHHIREGHIKVFDNIKTIDSKTIRFENGKAETFDAIVAAVGYNRDYPRLAGVDQSRLKDLNRSTNKQEYFGKDGLYFCGYWVSPTGQIREISLDAKKIARHIALQDRKSNNSI